MSASMWGLVALAGLALVAAGNWLRFRRTDNRGCLGHLFVAAGDLTRPEWALNRGGVAAFVMGVMLSVAG